MFPLHSLSPHGAILVLVSLVSKSCYVIRLIDSPLLLHSFCLFDFDFDFWPFGLSSKYVYMSFSGVSVYIISPYNMICVCVTFFALWVEARCKTCIAIIEIN